MPRRRRPLSVNGLIRPAAAALVAAAALSPVPSLAQTPPAAPSVNLLQPSLDGNPAIPPRFHRPGSGTQTPPAEKFVAPSRIGATPVYGSPEGFGAGTTGFDSTNALRRKRRARAPNPPPAGAPQPETTFEPVPGVAPAPPNPAVPPPTPPPEIHPAKAAARPGAFLPAPPDPLPVSNPPPEVHPLAAANRPGATLPIPPPVDFEPSASTPPPGLPPPNTLPLGTPPQRLLPIAEGDAYLPIGIRGGSLMFFPAVELSTAYSTNPQNMPGGAGSAYFVVAPELQVRSDWERNALTANITGSYTDYANGSFKPSLDRPFLNAKIAGRIDASRDTQIIVENRVIVATDNPGSPNLQAGLAWLPINTTVGGTLGVAQTFNRLQVTLKGTVDRSVYQNSVLTDGETSSNADRNFDQYGGVLRLGYELNPGLKPFVEVGADDRIHDEEFDRNGLQRDSNGASGKVGAAVNLFGSLTGEIAVGYMERTYKDPTLPDVGGAIADGALIWQATALTTAKFTAASTISESVVAGTSGELSRDFSLQVDHAFRRWLIGTLQAGFGIDDYVGMPRLDNRYFVSAGLTYKLNRDMQLKGTVRQDWLTSSASGVAYNATSFLLGLRLQR